VGQGQKHRHQRTMRMCFQNARAIVLPDCVAYYGAGPRPQAGAATVLTNKHWSRLALEA